MSKDLYNQTSSGTPRKLVDDGYVVRGSVQTSDGYTVKVCGLTQVDRIIESGSGVLTLYMSSLVNVLGVQVTGVDPAVSNLTCNLANVGVAGTNRAGNPSTSIVLQVFQNGTPGALTLSQGLSIKIAIQLSSVVVNAPQAGMVKVL